MRRLAWRTLAAGAVLAGVCVLLLVFGLFPQQWLRPIVERQVRDALGPGSRIGGIHVVPGRLRAVATDVVIEGRGFRLETPRLAMTLAFPTLLGRAVALRSFEMQRPVLTVWPVQPTGEPSGPAPMEQSVLVGEIAVTDGTFIYRDPALGGDWRVENVRLAGGIGEGTLKLDTGPVRWERPDPLVLEPIHAVASLSPLLNARIESLQIGTARSQLTASGDMGELVRPELDLRVVLRVDLADAAQITGTARGTGIVTGEAHLTGELPELAAKGRLQGRDLVIDGHRIETADVRFSRAGKTMSAVLDAGAFGGRLNATAKMNGTAIDASGRAVNVDLTRLGTATPGRATLDFKAHGTLRERLAVTGRLEANGRVQKDVAFTARATADGVLLGPGYAPDLRWRATGTADQPVDPTGAPSLQGVTWSADGSATGAWPPALNGRFDGAGRFVSGTAASAFDMNGTLRSQGNSTSASAVLTGDLGRVNVEATIAASGTTTFDLQGRDLRLERFARDTTGVATFSFKGQRRAGAFAGSGQGTIAGLHWSGVSFGALNIEARAEKETTHVTIRAPEIRAHADATIAPVRRGARDLVVTARVDLQDSPLAPFAPLAGRPLAGRVRGRFDIRAPLDALASARMEGQVEALDFESNALKAALQQPARLEATNRRLVVQGLSLTGPGFELKADGAIGLVPAEPLDARIQGTVDLAMLPAPIDWRLAGSARADVRVQGTRARPLAYGAVDLTQLAAAGPRLPPLAADKAHLELSGESLRIAETEASFAGGRIRMNGIVPLGAIVAGARPESAHIDLVWNGIDAAQIHLAASPDAEVAVTGVLEGEAHIAGPLTSLTGLTARVRTPPLRLNVQEMPVTVSGMTLDLTGGRVSMSPLELGTAHGSLRIAGGADLGVRTLNASASGAVDLRALSPFLQNAAMTGRAELDLKVVGPFSALRPDGRVVVTEGHLRMRDIQPAITGIAGTVHFDGSQVRVPDARAQWGGGPLTLSGTALLEKGGLRDVDFAIKGQEMALVYRDAKMLVTADLTMRGRTNDLKLAGTVTVPRGRYDRDLFIDDPLRAPPIEKNTSPFLRTMGLDLRVVIRQFGVTNNLAELRARGTFTVRGTADEPSPVGRLTITPPGKVILQQRKFEIEEEGVLTYTGTFSPDLDIKAVARNLEYFEGDKKQTGNVEIRIRGDLDRPFFEPGPDTRLSEREIASVIATGTLDPEGRHGLYGAASLLTSRLRLGLSSRVRGLGLDQVTIEPTLITRETHPGARLTFGKNLTQWSTLIYSFGLEDTEEPFFRLNVTPVQNVSASVSRRDDETYAGGISHRLELGAWKRPARTTPRREESITVREVRFEGSFPLEPAVMQERIDTAAGDKRTFWDIQGDADRLQGQLADLGHIEAQVVARIDEGAAVFTVRAGPRYDWEVAGLVNPPDLASIVKEAFYAEEALTKGSQRLLEAARDRGHLKATVQTEIFGEADRRTLRFDVAPGPAYAGALVSFEGARRLSRGTLLRAAGGAGELLTEPARARRRIEERYHEEYFLLAKVGPPQVEESGDRLLIRVPVAEGRASRISRVSFAGNSLSDAELRGYFTHLVGQPPDELQIPQAVQALRQRYFELGYPDVRLSSRLVPAGADLEMRVEIDEGAQLHIREIHFDNSEGNPRVPRSVMNSALGLRVGEPLDPRKLARAETRLTQLGVQRVRVESDPADRGRVVVRVRQPPRLVADYSLNMDTRSSPELAVDVSAPNVVGYGVTPGLVFIEQQFERKLRASLRAPALLHRGQLSFFFSRETLETTTDERRPAKDEPPENLVQQKTLRATATQSVELGGRWHLEYGYERSQVRTTAEALALPIDAQVGKLRATVARDTRDHLLDARRGRFWSVSFSYAPPYLGSDFEYVRGFGQVFAYRSLTPTVTWAQAYRLGAGKGLRGQRVFLNDRFVAGGARSLRGFATDSVGPLGEGSLGVESGDALVVLNQELRFHHPTGLGAVFFYDAGNVYRTLSEFDFELRHCVGAGLRYTSPVGLLRVDLGIPVNRRRDDEAYQVFFSLGQAF